MIMAMIMNIKFLYFFIIIIKPIDNFLIEIYNLGLRIKEMWNIDNNQLTTYFSIKYVE